MAVKFPTREPWWLVSSRKGVSRQQFYLGVVAIVLFIFIVTGPGPLSFSEYTRSPLSPNPSNIEVSVPRPAPQLPQDSRYHDDRLFNLSTTDMLPVSKIDTRGLRYSILLPTFVGHFKQAAALLQSLKCLCTDLDSIEIHIIVSDSNEIAAWNEYEAHLDECRSMFGRFETPSGNVGRPNPNTHVVNLFDILPAQFLHHGGAHDEEDAEYDGDSDGDQDEYPSRDDTSSLLHKHGKYAYQSLKKLAAAVAFDYDFALWLDSEGLAVQPFRMRDVFDGFAANPTVWRSRMAKNDFMKGQMAAAARTLGRSIESFGETSWYLDSTQWILEKAIVEDMVRFVEEAHGRDFWEVWLRAGAPFEVLILNMHIAARKMETLDPLFSKYRILESEREMIRFGIAPAFPQMESRADTGFIERCFHLLNEPSIAPNLAAFLRHHNQKLFRLETLDLLTPTELDAFLFDTPIHLLCSGAPDLYRWWKHRDENRTNAAS